MKAPKQVPAWLVPTGEFIRDHLLEEGEDYPYNVWKELLEKRARVYGIFNVLELRDKRTEEVRDALENHGVKVGSYQNVRNYFYWLRELGLIEKSREESSEKANLEPRKYYKVVEGKEDAEEWANPRKALYPESYEEHH